MFMIVPKDQEEKAHLCERVSAELSSQKERGEIRIFEIDVDSKNRPTIEEVDSDGNNEELAMQW